jgi:hypothetical protein
MKMLLKTLVVGFFLLTICFRLGTQELEKTPLQYPTNTCRYRGVVAANFVSYHGALADPDDELICDFGGQGVWLWDSGNWIQLSGANPDRLICGNEMGLYGLDLVGDFGAMGIWLWSSLYGTGNVWWQISGQNPSYMMTLNDDGDASHTEMHAAFPGLGLWRWGLGWMAVTGSTPDNGIASDFWITGWQEGVHGFGSQGVWNLNFTPGLGTMEYNQMSTSVAGDDHASAEFGVGDSSGELIMDFGSLGLWLAEEGTTPPFIWHKLSDFAPNNVREVQFFESGNPDYELLCDFTSASVTGLYLWNCAGFPGTWTKLANNEPGSGFGEPFNADGGKSEGDPEEEVAVDFEGLGLWLFEYSDNSWTLLSDKNPVFMVRADLEGIGKTTCLVVDFGPGVGLWHYNGTAETWQPLSSSSPDKYID